MSAMTLWLLLGTFLLGGCVTPREVGWAPPGYHLASGEHPWPWGKEGPEVVKSTGNPGHLCPESWGLPGNASSVCQPPTFWRVRGRS